MPQAVSALLFDLGGVIIDIDFDLVFAHWSMQTGLPETHFRERFYFDEPYQYHERGQIDSAEYFQHLRTLFGISLTDKEIDEGWNKIYVGIVPDLMPLLRSIHGKIPMYAFTNSNAAHRTHWSVAYAEELSVFEHVFDSSVIGLRKPEAASFELISAEINIPLTNILFFDDTEENIIAANALEIQTVHVHSFDDTKAAIEKHVLCIC